jgi:hypothetical protein
MIKLTDILKEIGDASTKPYYFEDVVNDENQRVYIFNTDSKPPTLYEVELVEIEPDELFSEDDEGVTLDIEFRVTDEDGHYHTDLVTNKGELYRVMATIVAIIKKDIEEHDYITTVTFTPEKRKGKDKESNVRGQLYARYVKHAMPNADISIDGSNVIVKLQ